VDWFLGTFQFNIDSQKRLAIPRCWRQDEPAENRFIVFPSRFESLQIVPAAAMADFLDQMRKVSFVSRGTYVQVGSIGGEMLDCRCDKQGRLTLTQELLDRAGIDGSVTLVGAVSTIQVWRPETWDRVRVDPEAGLDAMETIHGEPDELSKVLRKVIRE